MGAIEQAREALGQLFIMGFSGLELPDDTSAFLSQAKIGGVILFAHNFESPGQVAELSNQLQECRSELPLWISTDHEGGRGQRFKKGFSKIPDASVIGAIDSPKLAFDLAEGMARELKTVGINLNFSPVADIHTNPRNPVIGPRSYGETEDQVSKMVTAVVRGHLVAGVLPCAKHFPGHGDTHTDSHFALPKIETSLETLKERELRPFMRAFKSKCPMVMTAHIICQQLDPSVPATLSRKVLQDILRKELRYQGLVISDDMEMKAIADHFGPDDAPRMALEAGCDMLIYRTEAKARHAYQVLSGDIESGRLNAELVLAAAERVRAAKKENLLPHQQIVIADIAQKLNTPEMQATLQKVEEESAKLPRR